MGFCTLRPPNDRFLSDDIVAGVVQRRRTDRYCVADTTTNLRGSEYWRQPSCPLPQQPQWTSEYTRAREVKRTYPTTTRADNRAIIPEKDAVAVLGLLSLMNAPKRKRESPTAFTGYKTQRVAPDANTPTRQPETDTESLNSDKQEPNVTQRTARQDTNQQFLQRERQIQYRKQENEHMTSLEKETLQLREEIMTFEKHRRALARALPRHQNGWDVALEYFKLFRFGLQSTGRGRSSIVKESSAQVEFMRSTMASDVVFNTGQGPDAMLRSWKCISLWFQNVEVELKGLDRGAAGSVVAVTQTSVTINERTVRNVFPHLCNNTGARSKLAERLVGQRIMMRGLTRFEWDSNVGCFTSVMFHSDLLTPLLHILGNVEDVSRVFERSVLSPDFQWRSMA